MELSVALVRNEETTRVRAQAETNAEERLLDLLLPGSAPKTMQEPVTTFDTPAADADKANSTREKMRKMFREGKLDDREVEMELEIAPQGIEVMAVPGMETMGSQFSDLFSKAFPSKKKKKRMKIGDALPLLIEEEAARLVDEEKVTELAKERVEESGIIFIDEIDKVASSARRQIFRHLTRRCSARLAPNR